METFGKIWNGSKTPHPLSWTDDKGVLLLVIWAQSNQKTRYHYINENN